jgi:hypothetical protein
VVVKV